MKKPKRSFEIEEKELDYSRELGIELDDDQDDDEVLDLEDIIDLMDESEDEGQSLDVELLDVDSNLDLSDLDHSMNGSRGDNLLDDELLKEFSFEEPEEKAPEPPSPSGSDMLGQSLVDDLLKDFSFSGEPSFESEGTPQEDLLGGDLEGSDLESMMDFDKDLFSEPEKEARPPVVEAPKAAAPAVSAAPAVAATAAVAAMAVGTGTAGLDEFVAQIETRLGEAIREIIESRLPDIVRSILQEEIAKLKREF